MNKKINIKTAREVIEPSGAKHQLKSDFKVLTFDAPESYDYIILRAFDKDLNTYEFNGQNFLKLGAAAPEKLETIEAAQDELDALSIDRKLTSFESFSFVVVGPDNKRKYIAAAPEISPLPENYQLGKTCDFCGAPCLCSYDWQENC